MTTDHQPMRSPDDDNRRGELSDCARQAENAVRRLAHLTIRARLTPAEVDDVLGHLAETVAALPQVAAQLGGILDRSRDTHLLAMDGMTATPDPDLAIDTARLHLDELRGPALQTYRHLNTARNEVAHISATALADGFDVDAEPETGVHHRRPEDHQPPGPGPDRPGPGR